MKKWVSGAALATMVWSGTAGAAGAATATTTSSATAAANPFGDVKADHWAVKHITKLAMQGIIVGANGNFRPNDSIKREDVVIVALKFMGLADGIDPNAPVILPGSMQVDDYAKRFVNEAFKRKLLLASEETAIANQEKGKSWGKTNASREWVARLLVRAIGKDADAIDNTGNATTFSDDAKIDAAFKSYVLTAVQQGLVSGVTPTTFEPKSPITRAAIAMLFGKAESKVAVAHSGQISGTLLSIAPDKLTVLLDNGSVNTYAMSNGTLVARYDSDKPAALAALKVYGKINFITKQDGAVGYVEQTDDAQNVSFVEGVFSKLSNDGKVWLSVDNGYESYSYDSTSARAVTDAQGSTIALTAIPADAQVSLMMDRGKTKILSIKIKQAIINKNGSGTVVSWNASAGTLEVQDAAGAKETLTVSATATFKLGDAFVTRDVLKAGDTVTYEVKNSAVVSLQIAKPAVTTVSGKLFDINKTTKTIQYYENGKTKLSVDLLADNAAFKIDGLADAGYDDLQKDDAVALTYDAGGKVSQIVVSGRTVQTLVGATVASYTAKTRTLSLIDADNTTQNLILNDNVRYDLNGTKATAAEVLPKLVDGKKITVGYSGKNAVTVSLYVKYAGTVLENNISAKTLKLQLDGAAAVTVSYWNPTVEIYGKSTSSYTDLKLGDQVTVVLNGSQDQAGTVFVQKTAQFEVVALDTVNSKIRVKQVGATTEEEWSIPAAVSLQNELGGTAALAQFTAGTFVNATFQGKTPAKIKAVNVTYGRVSSVNTSASTVELVLGNGTTAVLAVSASPVVTRDAATFNSLGAVQPNDRVELRKDENDKTVIAVIPAVSKSFWRYDSVARTIQTQSSGSGGNDWYTIDAQTYIHHDATVLNPAEFVMGDVLNIYVVRGKVVEITK